MAGRPESAPGGYRLAAGDIELVPDRRRIELEVANTGDRPIQIGSHFAIAQANPALQLDRDAARGMRLDIPAGTAVRFEAGETHRVALVELGGSRTVLGHRGEDGGGSDDHRASEEASA
ncbi:MAG: urease subunit beta [Thermoleophilia bacterium]|nr:urease subunit beta [Thermoleophilia bacterium]